MSNLIYAGHGGGRVEMSNRFLLYFSEAEAYEKAFEILKTTPYLVQCHQKKLIEISIDPDRFGKALGFTLVCRLPLKISDLGSFPDELNVILKSYLHPGDNTEAHPFEGVQWDSEDFEAPAQPRDP